MLPPRPSVANLTVRRLDKRQAHPAQRSGSHTEGGQCNTPEHLPSSRPCVGRWRFAYLPYATSIPQSGSPQRVKYGTEVGAGIWPSGTVERGTRDSSPQGPLHGIHAIAALVNPFTSWVYGVSRKAIPQPRPDPKHTLLLPAHKQFVELIQRLQSPSRAAVVALAAAFGRLHVAQ